MMYIVFQAELVKVTQKSSLIKRFRLNGKTFTSFSIELKFKTVSILSKLYFSLVFSFIFNRAIRFLGFLRLLPELGCLRMYIFYLRYRNAAAEQLCLMQA